MANEFLSTVRLDDRTQIPGHLEFAVAVLAGDGATTIQVVGELDCHTAPRLRSTLLALVEDGVREVTLDLAGTSFVDSTGLSVLVGGLKRLRELGGDMVLESPTKPVLRVLELTGLDTVFTVG